MTLLASKRLSWLLHLVDDGSVVAHERFEGANGPLFVPYSSNASKLVSSWSGTCGACPLRIGDVVLSVKLE